MKKSNPNQKTLFQSWSKQSSSHGTSSRQDAQNNTRFDPLEIIELGDDDEDDGLLAAAMEMATVDENTLPQTSTTSHNNNANTSISSDSPKEIEHIPGFDMEAGNVWIYPTNYPIRNYQFQIVEKALMMNTLVTLPTGLGKTFIAAVLMYNYYRWYPQGKIIFMAPTKPLVAQQIEACYNIMGIPESDTTEMTGAMAPTRREGLWKSKRVFFLTAQVLMNDLGRGSCAAEDVVLLVFDEAHKALGNHSYCQVIREIHSYTRHFRVLALSATPGDDIKAVQQVMSNLLISHMELRSEDSPDIQAYTHKRTVDKIVVPVGEDIARIKTQFLKVLGGIVGRLFCNRALWQNDPQRVTKFMLLTGRTKFREREAEGYTNGQKGAIEGDFAMAISLYHAYELLHQHGILSFYNFIKAIVDGSKGMARARSELMRHTDFMNVMNELRELIEKPPDEMSAETSALFSQFTSPRRRSMMREAFDPSFKSHPKLLKLEEVIVEHFQNFSVKNNEASASTSESNKEVNTRVMIFSQYRDSVGEITAILNKHKPLVRVMSFIGQASTGKSSRGLSQKEQLEVVQRFRKGGYNTLVATCVGEEGLDIGDVDLIVCFDAHASPIRLVQRMGRTGRKRNGRIVVLVTEGKEEQVYKRSLSSKKSIHKAIVQGSRSFVLYDDNPRMIPRHLTPRVHKMEMTVGKYVGNSKKKRKSETDSTNGNIKNLLSKSTSSKSSTAVRKDDGFLTYEELEYWQKNFKLPNCEAGTTPSKRRRSRNSLPGPAVKELSLNEWMPWQNVPSPVDKIAHSRRTEHLIEILEFIELHNGEDDSYDVEMMSFLNENDLPNVDGGLEDDIDDAPLIILNDGDDVIRLGKEKEKNENQKKKRKVSNDSNAAESKKRKTSTDKTKDTSIKEKKKSKASKKPSPTRKWKDYLKAFENEDNDFEAVEKECTVDDNDSFETSDALLDGAAKEQPRGNFVVESEVENECVNPVKNVTEETDDNDDDTILSSQQVSQLLPSVNPSDPFLFRSKILDGKNCAREVPTPPSLDTLNEISPSVSSLTSKSHQNEKQKWDKLSSCRRNFHKDGKRDACEFNLMDSDFESGSGKMEVEGMKIEESPTKTAIIEEPPDVFDFDDAEFCDETIPDRSPKGICKEPPDVFEFDDTEFRDETITDKNPKIIFKEPPDVFQLDDHVEGLGQDEHNVHKVTTDEEPEKEKHKKEQQKENNENDDDFEEPFGLFEIDFANDMMDDNKNENVELDNKTASNFPVIDKNRNKIRDAPDPIHLEDIGDDLSRPVHKSLLPCNSSSKSSHDSVEFDFGEDSLSECLLADLVQDGNCEDKSCFSSNVPRKDVEEPTKEETKENCQSDSKEMLRNSKETSPKASKRRLESSISKLGAFERSTKTSDSSGLSNRVNDSIENNSKTVAESTRMTPTSEKRQNDDFEFKKPSISVLNHFPKSPGLRGFNEHTLEKHGLPQSKLTGVSTKLSLKKTAGNRLERGREGSVGKLASMNQNESEQVQSKVTFNKFDNIQMKIPKEKNLCTSLVNSRSQVQSKTKCQQQAPSLEQTGVCDEQTLKSPTCKNIGCTQSADEDSPVIRNRSKSTLRPTISSPVSPACHTPVGVKIITEADEESPLVRKRSKIKKKNGDVVAIAESDEEDEDEGTPTETRCVPERQITRKQRKDDMRKAKMILSDSEEEFIVENIKKGSKDKHDLNPRDRKMHLKASVKRKRQNNVIPSKKRRTHRIDDFLDEEAELSGTDIEEFSDDESDGDGEFDSFIDDSSQLTQNTPVQANPKKRKSNHDMLAVYRQSLFSPLARDLNFKSPTMCRNKNRYKMKYGVENCDESLSEAEETYARESDLENELGPDSDIDVSGDTLSVDDDESYYDGNDDNDDEKDSTPVASQIRRPFNRVKRKRIILNESIEESPVRPANTNNQSPIVTPSKACVTKPQYACPSKKSPFVTSSSIVNREPPTRESTPLNIRSNNTKSLSKDPNFSVDSNETMSNNNLSTTFEFDWGLDFSDSDLLDAVQDDKKSIDANSAVPADQDNINRKSDVCDQEMQEIAFAMAATDDDVNVEMSELPTFSLGLDLFGGDTEDIGTDVQENTSAKQRKDLNSVEESKKAQFTKISPRSSAVSNGRGNSNQNGKNMELPSAQHLKNSHFSTGQKMKNVGPSTTNSKLSTRQTVNNIGRYPSNGTLSADQNIHHVEPSSLPRNKAISSLCLGQNVKKNDAQNTNESTFSKPQNIMNTGAFKWSNSDTSTVANSGTTSKNQQQSRQCRTEKNSTSLVQPNTQANNKWSWGSNSSGRLSHLPSNGLKDVTNIDVKPGGSSNGVKSVPTAFVSPSQKDKGKLVVLADTKEISNSQVVSTLRRQHNIKVEVCQLQHCDYVVSNRMGVIRKLSSAVANGSNSTKILDRMRVVCDLYDRPCFIIEKDRVKSGETDRDYSKSNAYIYTLACMAQTHIKVLTSQSQEETASLLTDLATLEAKKNTHIVAPTVMNKETQQVFRFLLSIPRVSYVTALNLCSSLRTMRDLLSCSPEDLKKTTRQLSESRASELHSYLRHEFNESMINKNMRKNT